MSSEDQTAQAVQAPAPAPLTSAPAAASKGSFFHRIEVDVEGAAIHVVDFVKDEAPKLESFCLKVKTWIGSNKVAQQIFPQVLAEAETVVKADIAAVKTKLGNGATVPQIATAVKADIPALWDQLKSKFLAQVQALGGHESLLEDLLTIAYLAIGPNLSSIIGEVLAAA